MKFVMFLIAMLLASHCFSAEKKITVIATIFPLYDFARQVAGDRAVVKMLLPPGVEPHTFDPKPRDILAVNNASVFIYGGPALEPWAQRIVSSQANGGRAVVNASEGIALLGPDAKHSDPHIWLDPLNDQIIVRAIAMALSAADPQNKTEYGKNAEAYCRKLVALDSKIRVVLSRKKRDTLVYGGHAAFGYFAHRYGVNFVSPYAGYSPDAEPAPRRMAELIGVVRRYHAKVVYYEELFSPALVKTITVETGARILPLNAAHTVTYAQMASGITFVSIMENNLINLAEGLDADSP